MTSDLTAVYAAILAVLREAGGPLAPKDLIARVVALGHADADVRAAVWYLINDARVDLTPEFDVAVQP